MGANRVETVASAFEQWRRRAEGGEFGPEDVQDLESALGRRLPDNGVPTLLEALEELASASLHNGGGPAMADGPPTPVDPADLANAPPVVTFVSALLAKAAEPRVSDVHFEEIEEGAGRLRTRIDGVLREERIPLDVIPRAVVSRLKLLADLDIAERRRPQDGRIRAEVGGDRVELRISALPTVAGESIALRVLGRSPEANDLGALGMAPHLIELVSEAARRPHGLVIVTGPTGSGKTTSLYAMLEVRDGADERIITVEDPVEYRLPHITQVPVNESTGVSFASALRAILRQDPDVVLVGEMRDEETAQTAVRAALTGHMVFSTLHTNDAAGAITRLTDLGVPAFLLAETLIGVMAQRLVRTICASCRGSRSTCEGCGGSGLSGRTALFEWLPIGAEVGREIARGADGGAIRAVADANGRHAMRRDAEAKVAAGMTTDAEVARALAA